MIVEFIVRVTVKMPDSTDIDKYCFGDVLSIVEKGDNAEVIDHITESVNKLEED